MCKIGPHIYFGPDSTSRIQLSCFLTADGRASEIRISKALSKCNLNRVTLIHCLTDFDDSKEGDQVKVLPNPGGSDYSLTLHLRCKNIFPFLKSSFQELEPKLSVSSPYKCIC